MTARDKADEPTNERDLAREERIASRPHSVAARCGVSVETVRRWISRGQLRAIKRGGVVLVLEDDLAEFLGGR